MEKQIIVDFEKVADADKQLRNLAKLISEEFVVDITKSQGDFADELRATVVALNDFRRMLEEVIIKTSTALNYTIVLFRTMDESMSYRG